eukprot:m.53121 g.53121  ORF g.53121 m.53121 type:complete len:336 (-) comp7653_c2_seq1:554-1561(-)
MTSMRNKLASGWSRAKQVTGEKFGKAEKTEYDETFQELSGHVDVMKSQTEKLMKATNVYLEPNPNRRMEASVYARLKRAPKAHVNELENLGNAFLEMSESYEDEDFGTILSRTGEVEVAIGARFNDLSRGLEHKFIGPLRKFVTADIKHATNEKKALNTTRLDLDVAKAKLKKSTLEQQQANEATLMEKQGVFDQKFESVKQTLERTKQRHMEHSGVVLAMLKAQLDYFQQCSAELEALVSELEDNYHVQEAVSTDVHNAMPLHHEIMNESVAKSFQVRALMNRNAADTSEVTLIADEYVTVYPDDTTVPDGWVMVERDGLKGKVPQECLDMGYH